MSWTDGSTKMDPSATLIGTSSLIITHLPLHGISGTQPPPFLPLHLYPNFQFCFVPSSVTFSPICFGSFVSDYINSLSETRAVSQLPSNISFSTAATVPSSLAESPSPPRSVKPPLRLSFRCITFHSVSGARLPNPAVHHLFSVGFKAALKHLQSRQQTTSRA